MAISKLLRTSLGSSLLEKWSKCANSRESGEFKVIGGLEPQSSVDISPPIYCLAAKTNGK